jgi:polyisoprenyl-phosphate glycosyltransferase
MDTRLKLIENYFRFIDARPMMEVAMLNSTREIQAFASDAVVDDASASVEQLRATLRPRLALVVPCYNEDAALPETTRQLRALLDRLTQDQKIHPDSYILFVDDGSRDRTWQIIDLAHDTDARVRGLKLSRNCGHQNALLAGLLAVEGDITISLDADLQDDLGAIDRMLTAQAAGADIVYGVRSRRDVDTPFKRLTARLFYKTMNRLGVETVADHADFRLMSRRSIEALRRFGEVNLFLRGIVPMLGFKTETVTYERKARIAGETHYPLHRMLALAADGVFAFSTAPLQMILVAGIVVCLIAGGLACWALGVRLATAQSVPGWASVVIPIYFLGGLQMLGLGIVGGYVARIYAETKQRPRYIVEQSH